MCPTTHISECFQLLGQSICLLLA